MCCLRMFLELQRLELLGLLIRELLNISEHLGQKNINDYTCENMGFSFTIPFFFFLTFTLIFSCSILNLTAPSSCAPRFGLWVTADIQRVHLRLLCRYTVCQKNNDLFFVCWVDFCGVLFCLFPMSYSCCPDKRNRGCRGGSSNWGRHLWRQRT